MAQKLIQTQAQKLLLRLATLFHSQTFPLVL